MTRGDQEAFALIAEKEAHTLTKQNALIDIAFSPQYYIMIQGTGWAGRFVTEEFSDSVDEVAYGLTGFIIAANLIRLGLATKKKKSYASISIESAIMNGPTYLKRLKQKLFG
jgi:predicted permease